MQKENERKAKGLNDKELRLLHWMKIDSLEKRVYDKSYINDNELDFKYLTDKANYRPLGQKRRWFFMYPLYAHKGDFR